MRDYLPMGCITQSALFALAGAMKRLQAWHVSMGGPAEDEPCLREVRWDEIKQRALALVMSGHTHFELVYKNREWMPLSEALKDE